MTPLIIPPRLALGDTIGLVAPASSTEDPARIDEVIAHLKKEGFAVKPGANLRCRTGYLAGTDEGTRRRPARGPLPTRK